MPRLPLKRRSSQITQARQVIDMVWQYRISRLVMVAHRTGVFRALGPKPASAADLASELRVNADMLERVLIACCALGLVRREDATWALTPKAQTTLLPESPYYQGDYIDHLAGVWDFWHDLEHVLRDEKGASTFSPQASRAREHRAFILAMHNLAMAGRAAELVSHLDLTGRRSLLDVGGGPGTYAIAFCQRFPDLRVTLFDLPETTAIAGEVLARYDMADRVRLFPGNWDTDAFPGPQDAVFMSNILHGAGSDAQMKLAKAHRALNSGGLLLIQDFFLNDEKTGPLLPALFNVMVGAFSLGEMLALIDGAGFAHQATVALAGDSAQTLIVARKGSAGPG